MLKSTDRERPTLRDVLEDPAAAARRLERIQAGHPEGKELLRFLEEQLVDVPDPDRALRNLEKLSEVTALPAERENLFRVLVLFGSSQFLSQILLRNPALVGWLSRQGSLQARKSREDLAQELARFHFTATTEDHGTILRQFKDREYLRISLRDLLQIADLGDTTEELSDLADVLLEKSLLLTQQSLLREHGIPQYYDAQGKLVEATFAVISLGKLGGRELNYSSDIDLLFLYSMEGETSGQAGAPGSAISNREWFTRLAEGILERIGGVGPSGRVFRVDMELRPGGRDGELVQSLRSVLSYYQVWGKGWERQALLKARRSAGNEELAKRFLEGVSDVVYDETLSPSFAREVAAIQEKMAERLSEGEKGERDLKHGRGGIRELELSLQALQLIHGGRDAWLREGNSLRALHRLSDRGLISSEQHEVLMRAYGFLRRVEHRLQLPTNRQTFRLPAGPGQIRLLARSMAYRDGARKREGEWFLADLEEHRTRIREFYDSVLGKGARRERVEPEEPDLLLDPMPEESLRKALGDRGFPGPEALLRPLNAIRKTLVPFRAEPGTAFSLRKSTPGILRVLLTVPNPSRGWRNLDLFLNSLARKPALLRDFFLRLGNTIPVVDLLARSNLLANLLIHRPGILNEIPTGPEVLQGRGRREFARALRRAWDPSSGSAAAPPALCRVQRREILRIGFRDLQGGEGVLQVQRSLADLAGAVLREALYAAAIEVLGSRKAPRRGPRGFAVLALGRLAARELNYLSDLDIVFVRADPAGGAFPFHREHQRTAEQLIQILSTITQDGYLYDVDLRLRPSGGEGELVPTLGHILRYFEEKAEPWERQSFLGVRPVAGDARLATRAVEGIAARIFPESAPRDLATTIAEAKARLEERAAKGASRIDLKVGPGGILDIQFLLQYLQLSTRHREAHRGDPLALMTSFRKLGILSEGAYRCLLSGFRFLRALEHNVQLVSGRRSSDVSFSGAMIRELAVAMDCGTSEALMAKLAEFRREIRRVRDSFFHGH